MWLNFEPDDEFGTTLQYERINISEGNDIYKTSLSRKFMICHYWYFKDLEFKFDSNICNKCSIGWIFSKSKRIEILNVKGVHYRCILCGISRNKVVNILNNSGLVDKGVIILNNPVSEGRDVLYMDFGANKRPIEVTKEGAFGGTYFRDIYFDVNGKWYKMSWKEFDHLKNID